MGPSVRARPGDERKYVDDVGPAMDYISAHPEEVDHVTRRLDHGIWRIDAERKPFGEALHILRQAWQVSGAVELDVVRGLQALKNVTVHTLSTCCSYAQSAGQPPVGR